MYIIKSDSTSSFIAVNNSFDREDTIENSTIIVFPSEGEMRDDSMFFVILV